MLFDIAGVTILALSAILLLAGAYLLLRSESRSAGAIFVVAALAGAGTFLYLTRSTTARRAFINLEMRTLALNFAIYAAALIAACAIAFLLYRVTWWLARGSYPAFGALAAAGFLLVSAALIYWLYDATFQPDLDEIVVERSALPEAEAWIFDDAVPVQMYEGEVVQQPTALELGPNNELYVAGNTGSIWVIFDHDQNGTADEVLTFAEGLDKPQGLAWSEAGLYVNVNGQLLLLSDTDGDWVADQNTVIVDNLPKETYAFHRNHGLTFGPDGRLYIGVGATSDANVETNPLAARVLSALPDGSDLQVYVTGVRNPYGIVPAPDGDGFFAIDNGSSGCLAGDCTQRVDVPEEVNFLRAGNDYGFPDYFGVPDQSSTSMPPVVSLPDHSAPTGIVFIEGDAFPHDISGQMLVSLWVTGEIWRFRLFRIDEDHYTASGALLAKGLAGPSAIINSPYGGVFVASLNGSLIYHLGALPGQIAQ